MAALATGQDMNNPADLAKVQEKLQALKPQIKTFWSSEDEWNKHMAAHDYDIAVYWSGLGRPQQEGLQSAGRFRGAAGGRDRLV